MKTVLCLDYYFPPLSGAWVGGFKFIRFLPEHGWKPIVVSADESVAYQKDYSLLPHVPKKIDVHRVGHAPACRAWQRLRRKLKLAWDFPDSVKDWYQPALHEARWILRREPVDLIFSASPSFTTACVAWQLRQEFNIPWIAEFQDAWSSNDYLRLALQQSAVRPLRSRLLNRIRTKEGLILRGADRVVVIHETLRHDLIAAHQVSPEKLTLITDGYCESDFTTIRPRLLYPEVPNVVFLGSAYTGYRELALSFCRALACATPAAEVVFIGRGSAAMEGTSLTSLTLISNLPKEKALAFGAGAQFLLLIVLPTAKWHTPSKLYDYLRLGRPILAVVPPDGDAARLITTTRAGFVLSYDAETMCQQLQDIIQGNRLAEFQPNRQLIAQYERGPLTAQMIRTFNEVCGKTSG